MCESEVKAAMPEVNKSTAAQTSFQDSQSYVISLFSEWRIAYIEFEGSGLLLSWNLHLNDVTAGILYKALHGGNQVFQVMSIPRKGGQCLAVIYSIIVALNTRLFTRCVRRHPSKRINTKKLPGKLFRCLQEPKNIN